MARNTLEQHERNLDAYWRSLATRRATEQQQPEPARVGRVEDYYPEALRKAADEHNQRVAVQREARERMIREKQEGN